MLRWIWIPLALVINTTAWAENSSIMEESLYQKFYQSIQAQKNSNLSSFSGFSSFEQSLFVDALWDLTEEENTYALSLLENEPPFHYDLVQKLRLSILRIKFKKSISLPEDLVNELHSALTFSNVDIKLIYLIASYEKELLAAGHQDLITSAKSHNSYGDILIEGEKLSHLSDDMIADLFHEIPDTITYMNGEYAKSVKLFMFCRTNRLYPCLMVMRDIHGEVVREDDGIIWSHPSLGSSAKGLPSYYRNGNTPAGIFTIDSVMPVADEPLLFGKHRRMILNFVPKSEDETLFKSLLPQSSIENEWWKTSIVARDNGRNLFRIHGTQRINKDPRTPYYPFTRTNGCVAQRENTYDGITYQDQRNLLDAIMRAMELEPIYENEPKVKGFLYVVEIDDKNAPVTLSDLAERGIE